MLPDSTAKDLLAQAADTVEVTPSSGRALVASAQRSRNRRWVVAVGAAAVTTAVVVGVAVGVPDTRPVPAPPPVASSSPTPTTSGAPGGRVGVPILVKYSEDEAVQRVHEWGLVAEVVHRAVPCRPAGSVVDQEPRAATKVAAGSTVTVVVADRSSAQADCPEGVSFDDDRQVARLIYDFSRGMEDARLPWAPTVTLSLAGTTWTPRSLTERQADDRDRWRLDGGPGGGPDIDVLGFLADSDGEYRVDIGPHLACVDGPAPSPARGFEGLRQLSITPRTRESCMDWWAVDVYLNEVGQIEDVSLQRWEW